MGLELNDTANDRVLNMLQGLEVLMLDWIKTNPANKEEVIKYLGLIRKSLEGQYDKLPQPSTRVSDKSTEATPQVQLDPWQDFLRIQQGNQQQAAQQQGTQQQVQIHQANAIPGLQWFRR